MTRPIECVLLGLLHVRPLTSYDAHKALQALAAHRFSPSYGTLNPALKRLEKREWVHGTDLAQGGRRKREYAITQAGQDAFHQWMHDDPVDAQGENGLLVRLFFLGLLPEEERLTIVRALADSADAFADAMAAQRTDADQKTSSVGPPFQDFADSQLATLDYGIARHRFVGDWLRQRYLAGAP